MRDETLRRGFRRERHAGLKLCIAGVALTGFGVTWFEFSSVHDDALLPVPPSPSPAAVTTTQASGTTRTTEGEQATPTARARTSRGS